MSDRPEQLGWEPLANVAYTSSGKEEHLQRTRGEDDEVQNERQYVCLRRPEAEEQDRAERLVQDAQHPVDGTRDETTAHQEDQGGTSRAITTHGR